MCFSFPAIQNKIVSQSLQNFCKRNHAALLEQTSYHIDLNNLILVLTYTQSLDWVICFTQSEKKTTFFSKKIGERNRTILFNLKAVTHYLLIFSYFSVFFFLLLSTCYLVLSLKLHINCPECGMMCLYDTIYVLVKYGTSVFYSCSASGSTSTYYNFPTIISKENMFIAIQIELGFFSTIKLTLSNAVPLQKSYER